MAKKPMKFGPRKRYAEGGTDDRYKARYDRKVADIESDYKKAQANKTGRAAEVAKAKYEQRMADAKDDLAKWTGGDRTATRAGEKAAERNLTLTRRYGSAEPKLEDKPLATPKGPSDTEAAKISAMAPKGQTFKQAFAAARKNPEAMKAGKFTWNGKSFSTALASEKKTTPTPVRRTTVSAAAKTPTPASTPKQADKAPESNKGTTSARTTPARTAPGYTQTAAEKRAAELRADVAASRKLATDKKDYSGSAIAARLKNAFGINAARENTARALEQQSQRNRWQSVEAEGRKNAEDYAKSKKRAERIAAGNKPNATPTEKFYAKYPDAMKKGGAVKKMAKGGKVDGCAVRGKTRARMK